MPDGFREQLDELEEERSLSYERFEQYGDDFIDVMDVGVPEIEDVWASADQILEASDTEKDSFKENPENRVFASIYNLMSEVDILPAFHDSEPYEIKASDYETEPLIEAWEYVSGETYEKTENEDLSDKRPEEVDDLHHELKE